jgi:hypothetical protein
MSLFPESRLLFLVRDGRDVIDSLIDAMLSKDSWWQQSQGSDEPRIVSERMAFINHHAKLWLQRTQSTERGFAMLPGEQRYRVGYENLLTDTVTEFTAMLDWLGMDLPADQIEAAVERRSFKAIPDSQKGPGKRARSANPGQWKERLRPGEIDLVERVMGPKLRELGYEVEGAVQVQPG